MCGVRRAVFIDHEICIAMIGGKEYGITMRQPCFHNPFHAGR